MRLMMSRRPSLVLLTLVGLLWLAGWGEITLHQHHGAAASHSCAVCNAAHASAVPVLDTVAPAPRLAPSHRVVAVIAGEARDDCRGPRRTRAPPTA